MFIQCRAPSSVSLARAAVPVASLLLSTTAWLASICMEASVCQSTLERLGHHMSSIPVTIPSWNRKATSVPPRGWSSIGVSLSSFHLSLARIGSTPVASCHSCCRPAASNPFVRSYVRTHVGTYNRRMPRRSACPSQDTYTTHIINNTDGRTRIHFYPILVCNWLSRLVWCLRFNLGFRPSDSCVCLLNFFLSLATRHAAVVPIPEEEKKKKKKRFSGPSDEWTFTDACPSRSHCF